MSLPNYKQGQYICIICNENFSWGYGFMEKRPEIKDEERIKEKCPKCCGLEFHDPKDLL